MKTIKARVESAILDDNVKGIFLVYTDMTGKEKDYISSKEEQTGVFVPTEVWGRIPKDKNPRIELQKIVDLLNGFKKNGREIESIPDWESKIINIEVEG